MTTKLDFACLLFKYQLRTAFSRKYIRLTLYAIDTKLLVETHTCRTYSKYGVKKLSKILQSYRCRGIQRGRDLLSRA